ncbi:MAG: biotin synthase BioB [Candidatus Competibacteraceae bacterium]|nr:biotin synthase BioB [Candidatus Competibacteraceae bacterium]MBK7984108.1 biotin synthase BioB [Candidatus Competibacteraceae bacterium]MBK8896084.1 biotin synthase BioB [Candidatus Competibacteraceae bacterium]MBK8963501.1 biotin synthase BioB [Candidatus Competibacteraceae bacterium]
MTTSAIVDRPAARTQPPAVHPAPAWTVDAVLALFELPFADLLFRAQEALRAHFDPNAVQRSTLLSIKTGNCSEDCGYCSQSKRHQTGLEAQRLLSTDEVLAAAKAAKAQGAGRFCMGAAWRGPKEKDMAAVAEMVREVKALGLETCVTLGILKDGQAEALKVAGLDYYNHNLDTAPEFYGDIVTTHTYQDRLDTLQSVREAGLKVCSGGIVGMGETRRHRAGLIAKLASLDPPPESVPINNLVPVPGTPLADSDPVDIFEFARTIAAARITMPRSYVRLSAGREQMSEAEQTLCFLAGANSIFYGDQLLTTRNPRIEGDNALFEKLGLRGV